MTRSRQHLVLHDLQPVPALLTRPASALPVGHPAVELASVLLGERVIFLRVERVLDGPAWAPFGLLLLQAWVSAHPEEQGLQSRG